MPIIIDGHCKYCLDYVWVNIKTQKGQYKFPNHIICNKCYNDRYSLEAIRDKKLNKILNKKWWQFWK